MLSYNKGLVLTFLDLKIVIINSKNLYQELENELKTIEGL
jgi:hypothetical protein